MMITETESTGPERSKFHPVGTQYPISTIAPWLLGAKVTLPERADFYFHRPRLLEQFERTGLRIVVVRAPAGFGKTTLLSQVCRAEREGGMLGAWLTLDEDDTEETVGMYLMYAFERAGLDISVATNDVEYRVELLAREVERHAAPCLLVLDEAERLTGNAIDAVDFLLHHAPPNLRIVIGLRSNPGLDVAPAVLDGTGSVLSADQLRFSNAEIADFFDGRLTRRELATVVERAEGWPVALRLYRNIKAGGTTIGGDVQGARDLGGDEGIAANWLGSRLLRNLGDADREFLLDLALFDWVDTALVDEVLARNDSGRRIIALTALDGLLQPLSGDEDTKRLHPLVKNFCSAKRLREDQRRFRRLHREIALALIRRGHLLPSIRHAAEAGDTELVGDVLVRVGGLRLWLREGMTRLGAADRFLTQEVVDSYPRLALLRCRLLVQQSRLVDARSLYETVKARTGNFTTDRAGGDDHALRVDGTFIKATLVGYGCLPIGADLVAELAASMDLVKRETQPDAATVAAHASLLFAAHNLRASFARGNEFGAEAEAQYALCESWYGSYHVGLHYGIAAMAQGRIAEAEAYYQRSARIAKQHFPLDSGLLLIPDILLAELNLERNRTELLQEQASAIPIPLRYGAAWLDIYVAAHEVAAEWRYGMGGIEDALMAIEPSRNAALDQGLTSVARHLSALEAGYLVTDGRLDAAHRVWHDGALPEDLHGLLDLDGQSWREMDAICCARIRLLGARGDLQAANDLADNVIRLARERGLTRTLMRCLAVTMAVQYRAGNVDEAVERLVDGLRLLPAADFSRPLVREREASLAVSQRLLGGPVDPELRNSAESLILQLGETEGAPAAEYTIREVEILEWLGRGRRDKEIARHLGLTVDGVRYHLRNIYRKTGASGRLDAVRRARLAGVIS